MKVKVTDGLQVSHDGNTWRDGATADVPDEVARGWLEAGWVKEIRPAKARSTKP